MAFRDLDITLISAQKLNKPSRFKKIDVYAVVSVSDAADNGSCRLEDKTEVDLAGDTNPRWQTGFRFKLDEPALQANRLTLLFNLLAGDKDVAVLSLAVKSLLDHSPAAGDALSLAYDLRKPGGKSKAAGQLTFSFKFGEKPAPPPPAAAAAPPANEPGMVEKGKKVFDAVTLGVASGLASGMKVVEWGVKKGLERQSGSGPGQEEKKYPVGRPRAFNWDELPMEKPAGPGAWALVKGLVMKKPEPELAKNWNHCQKNFNPGWPNADQPGSAQTKTGSNSTSWTASVTEILTTTRDAVTTASQTVRDTLRTNDPAQTSSHTTQGQTKPKPKSKPNPKPN